MSNLGLQKHGVGLVVLWALAGCPSTAPNHMAVDGETPAPRGCDAQCPEDGAVRCAEGGCAEPTTCVYGGEVYAVGDMFEATDGCNSCTCYEHGVECTLIGCVNPCVYAGTTYTAGESFPSSEDCNTCTCEPNGEVSCTEKACDLCELPFDPGTCDAIISAYWFDMSTRSCVPVTWSGCGGNGNRFSSLQECEETCGHARASDNASCLVDGQVYAHGETMPDPYSCNTCTCDEGQLGLCTLIGCGKPCPADTVRARGCAECDVAGGCATFEIGCLPTCEGDADCDVERSYCVAGRCQAAALCD